MSWLSDITGLSEGEIALPSPSWTGTVDSATSGGITVASATGLLKSVGSAVGSVADFGFNLQKQQMQVQSQAQDNQLKGLLGTLGFKTAVTQANAQAQIAGYQAQGAVATAARSAGISTGQGVSMAVVALIAVGAYLFAKKG